MKIELEVGPIATVLAWTIGVPVAVGLVAASLAALVTVLGFGVLFYIFWLALWALCGLVTHYVVKDPTEEGALDTAMLLYGVNIVCTLFFVSGFFTGES